MTREDTLKPLGGQCSKCLKQKVQCICHTMFKVGDWVKIKGTLESDIFKLTENEIKYKEIILGHFIFEENTWTHWQPKEGEWVIQKINENSFQVFKFNPYFNYTDDVEPFIGELPSFIKDK